MSLRYSDIRHVIRRKCPLTALFLTLTLFDTLPTATPTPYFSPSRSRSRSRGPSSPSPNRSPGGSCPTSKGRLGGAFSNDDLDDDLPKDTDGSVLLSPTYPELRLLERKHREERLDLMNQQKVGASNVLGGMHRPPIDVEFCELGLDHHRLVLQVLHTSNPITLTL